MSEPRKVAPKGKPGRKPKLDSELVAAALAELQGNVSATGKRFNVSRHAVEKLIARRPALQRVVKDAREGMLDNAESSLYRAVLAGEAWAVCFFLKTQGKPRGYIERVNDADPDKKPDLGIDLFARLVAKHLTGPVVVGGVGPTPNNGTNHTPLAP